MVKAIRDRVGVMRRFPFLSSFGAAALGVTMLATAALTVSPAAAADAYVTPGDAIVVTSGERGGLCTLGPYMVVDGVYGAVTAGHCGQSGATVSLRSSTGDLLPITKLRGSTDTDTTDSAFVSLPTEMIEPSASILGKYPVHGAMDLAEIIGVLNNPLAPSTRVCSYGVTSGSRCGNITGASAVYSRIYARFPSDKGDSGGPVWAADGDGVRVVGILRGKLNNDPTISVILPISVAIREQDGKLLSAP